MATSNNFNSRLSQLQTLEKSQDYLNIINILNKDFDSDANNIIEKWTSNESLSNDDTKYIDLYSNIQLSYVKYCVFNWLTKDDVQTMIEKLPGRLFQKNQNKTLEKAVEYIREHPSSNTQDAAKDDLMLVSLMRMIDARSLAYRLCFEDIGILPKNLNEELYKCLIYDQAKKYLSNVKSTNDNVSIDLRHHFFMGCCTFAVALYRDNKEKLQNDEDTNKYIYVLAKYVRIVLNKNNFVKNKSLQYCVRGILALLTNCIPHEYWLDIMNKALADENDEDLQVKNPLNIDLFSSIVKNLLTPKILQEKTKESGSNDETLLLDTTMVFVVKWCDKQGELDNDDDEEDRNSTKKSSPEDEPNQLLRHFNSNEQFQNIAKNIIPYIDAKYDRLRLLAISLLSNIMSAEDFSKLHKNKEDMAKDLVKLIFNFIDQAEKQTGHTFKGISFNTLLDYLLRFLVQDFIKQETILYVSQIVKYAEHYHLYALKILRRISTAPHLIKELTKNADLKRFLETDADNLYRSNEKMYKVIKSIRENLTPPPKPAELLRK